MAYIGSCPDMCPEKERQARYGLYMSIFERDQNNEPDVHSMVKEYRRSGADQEEPAPEDLRTPEALELTLDYLVNNIMDDQRSKTQELDWYDFLWDRLRAIRKDITQQNICDQASAMLVERCARFHVHCCYSMNQVKDFDVDMNKKNMNDCLQMLRQMYSDLKVSTGSVCGGELEFQKYDILLHLNQDHLSSTLQMKMSDYRSSNEMKFIIKVFSAYTNNDYYRFFRAMEQADYMTSCVLSLYANKMRLNGFKTIINACAPRQSTIYPAELLVKSLGFDDHEDLRNFASNVGIETQFKDGRIHLVLNKDLLPMLRTSETSMAPFKSKRLVEYKMQGSSVGRLVYGQEGFNTMANPLERIREIMAARELDSQPEMMQIGDSEGTPERMNEAILDRPMERTPPQRIPECVPQMPTSTFSFKTSLPVSTPLTTPTFSPPQMPLFGITTPIQTQTPITTTPFSLFRPSPASTPAPTLNVEPLFRPEPIPISVPNPISLFRPSPAPTPVPNPMPASASPSPKQSPICIPTRPSPACTPTRPSPVHTPTRSSPARTPTSHLATPSPLNSQQPISAPSPPVVASPVVQHPGVVIRAPPELEQINGNRNEENLIEDNNLAEEDGQIEEQQMLMLKRVRSPETMKRDMPAGFFKVRSLSSRVPKLCAPKGGTTSPSVCSVGKLTRESDTHQHKRLKAAASCIQEEKDFNKAIVQITKLFTSQ